LLSSPRYGAIALVDVDTFLNTLDVMVDGFGKTSLSGQEHPGSQAVLSRSEVMPWAIFGQWQAFGSERGFERYARRHLRAAFPQFPTREQLTHQIRQPPDALIAIFLPLGQLLATLHGAYEALESSGSSIRDAKRRGSGWLPGLAAMGWSNHLGW
jgi:hypothetical protein